MTKPNRIFLDKWYDWPLYILAAVAIFFGAWSIMNPGFVLRAIERAAEWIK